MIPLGEKYDFNEVISGLSWTTLRKIFDLYPLTPLVLYIFIGFKGDDWIGISIVEFCHFKKERL